MLQPRVFVKSKNKVYDVAELHFDIKIVAYENGVDFNYPNVHFKKVEFMENTGFKDKNGKYIYEDDIVKNDVNTYTIKRSEGYKVFSMYNGNLYVLLDESICKEIEVIGNIYENKELLEC
jgi:uncharacterized phage protein (TIGR01671 family)